MQVHDEMVQRSAAALDRTSTTPTQEARRWATISDSGRNCLCVNVLKRAITRMSRMQYLTDAIIEGLECS